MKSTDPTLDNDGNALVAGSLYFSSTDNAMKVYTGSAWVAAYVSGAGTVLAANNLSDLSSISQARTNLGLAIGTNVQAWDGDLDAIAALAGTSGLLKKTGANTWALDTSAYLTSVTKSDIGLGSVENTALSTWAGSTNITTLGTIATGTWSGSTIAVSKGGTGLTSLPTGYIPFGNGTNAFGSSITLFWDNTNSRLGLGTTTPAYTLDVFAFRSRVARNTSGFAETLISNTGGNLSLGLENSSGGTLLTGALAYAGVINVTGSYALHFATSNTLRMTVSPTGDVGIGTSSPSHKLDVSGTGRFTGALTLGTALSIANGGTGATDAATARSNLGLGSAATESTQAIANTVLAAIPDPVAMALVFGS